MSKKDSIVPVSSKSSLQRLLHAQKNQIPKLKVFFSCLQMLVDKALISNPSLRLGIELKGTTCTGEHGLHSWGHQ